MKMKTMPEASNVYRTNDNRWTVRLRTESNICCESIFYKHVNPLGLKNKLYVKEN